MKPAWHDNILACYPALLARIGAVPGVRTVLEAHDLASLGHSGKQAPLDGAVYVVLDGFTPTQSNNSGREQRIEIGFSVILTKRSFTPRPQPFGVGETLTALASALQGFDPEDGDGRALVTTPFTQVPALSIRYRGRLGLFSAALYL